MNMGTLYGIGIGPGDPELITLKGARILGESRRVFVPVAPGDDNSLALSIARRHIHADAEVNVVEFPMSSDRAKVRAHWDRVVPSIKRALTQGDVCYLTLGDALIYSTYVNMIKALRRLVPDARVMTIPGITSFSAAAALTETSLGEAKRPLVIIPVSDDLSAVEHAVGMGGSVVLMKVGSRLGEVIDVLERLKRTDEAVFIARVGLVGERIETDLRKLKDEPAQTGHMSVILVS